MRQFLTNVINMSNSLNIPLLIFNSIEETKKHLEDYSTEGLRVLVFARKEIPE